MMPLHVWLTPRCPPHMLGFMNRATGFERFMLKTKSVSDGTAEEWLQGKLAKYERDKRRWPLTLPKAWKMMGLPEQVECQEAVVPVAYCTNPKCQRRITPEDERRSCLCSKCFAPWFDRLPSGKPNVFSFDYFIRSEWSFAQMLALPEFSDALIEFWPEALRMMSQDPEDLTVPALCASLLVRLACSVCLAACATRLLCVPCRLARLLCASLLAAAAAGRYRELHERVPAATARPPQTGLRAGGGKGWGVGGWGTRAA